MSAKKFLSRACMATVALGLILPLPGLPGAANSAQAAEVWGRTCKKIYKQYRLAQSPKAIAITVGVRKAGPDGQACGAAWGGTKKAAQSAALAYCKKQRYGSCFIWRSE